MLALQCPRAHIATTLFVMGAASDCAALVLRCEMQPWIEFVACLLRAPNDYVEAILQVPPSGSLRQVQVSISNKRFKLIVGHLRYGFQAETNRRSQTGTSRR